MQSRRTLGGITLYASLFEPSIKRLDLYELPTTHRDGPIFLNVQRYLDMPQAVAMAAERSQVVLYQKGEPKWDYPESGEVSKVRMECEAVAAKEATGDRKKEDSEVRKRFWWPLSLRGQGGVNRDG